MKRKHIVRQSAALALAAVLTLGSLGTVAVQAADDSFGENFTAPATDTSIKIRTWWPSADISDEEIADEVQQIAEAGFGGIELIGITESYDASAVDAENYGWSTENWNHAVDVLMDEAAKYDLDVDLTIGPRWPAGVPGLDLDSEASSKRIDTTVIHTEIESTDSAVFDLPEVPESENGATLVSVVAARTEGTLVEKETETEAPAEEPAEDAPPVWGFVATAEEYGIYSDSLTLISDEDIDLENGTFSWTPSEEGEWTVFAFWSVPTAQTSGATTPTAYVIDHFSKEGTEAILNYWEENMLSDTLKEYWAEHGGDLFEDSLELDTCDIPWSDALEEYFASSKGYNIDQYLPLLVSQFTVGNLEEKYNVLDNDTITDEIYNDFFENLSDMYIENHVQVIEAWCQDLNVNYRAQAQGTSDNGWVDSIEAASYVDVAEGETLGMASSPDAFRSLAGAANMGGTEIVSVELGADFGALYQITWQDLNELLNRAAMAGANQFVLHGFATDSQTTSYNAWPGWMPFDEPMFSEAWGSRQPSWDYMTDFTNYVSRLQTSLQYGTADVDFAVYRDDLGIRTDEGYTTGVLYLDENSFPAENVAVENGYVYNYISPGNFSLDTAVVEDGELNPEYAGYKALVINNESEMALEDAETILAYAEAGLPIILIGETPSRDGTYSADDDEAVAGVFETLKGMDEVISIESEEELPDALKTAGILPTAQYDDEIMLAVQHRSDETTDIYYFYNYTNSYDYSTNADYYSEDAAITTTVTLEGNGSVYLMDPWSGEITALTDYTSNEDGTVTLELTVNDGDAVLIAITEDDTVFADASEEKTITEGTPISLDDNTWTLDVTSYEPGELAMDRESEDYDPTDIAKVAMDPITLDSLTAWDTIEGLENISGQGLYSTVFTIDEEASGAILDLGDSYDNILEVTINGNSITGINQITHEVDLGSYITEGENTLEIRTGTTLCVAVRAAGGNTSEADSSMAYPTTYGLLGGISITPYM